MSEPPTPPRPAKDRDLWWVVAVFAGLGVLSCMGIGAVVFLPDDVAPSASSSSVTASVTATTPAPTGTDPDNGIRVEVGDEVTVGGANVLPDWHYGFHNELAGVRVVNTGESTEIFQVNFFFMSDGEVQRAVTCRTDVLAVGERDDDPRCDGEEIRIDDVDEVLVTEGNDAMMPSR